MAVQVPKHLKLHRRRRAPGRLRDRRAVVLFTDEEWDQVVLAAATSGLAPAAWMGDRVMAAAQAAATGLTDEQYDAAVQEAVAGGFGLGSDGAAGTSGDAPLSVTKVKADDHLEALDTIISARDRLASVGDQVNEVTRAGNSGAFPPAGQVAALYAIVGQAAAAVTSVAGQLLGRAYLDADDVQLAMGVVVSTSGQLTAVANNVNQMAGWGSSGRFELAGEAVALHAAIWRADDALDDAAARIQGRAK